MKLLSCMHTPHPLVCSEPPLQYCSSGTSGVMKLLRCCSLYCIIRAPSLVVLEWASACIPVLLQCVNAHAELPNDSNKAGTSKNALQQV